MGKNSKNMLPCMFQTALLSVKNNFFILLNSNGFAGFIKLLKISQFHLAAVVVGVCLAFFFCSNSTLFCLARSYTGMSCSLLAKVLSSSTMNGK
jgi:hypothetical protein